MYSKIFKIILLNIWQKFFVFNESLLGNINQTFMKNPEKLTK